MTTVEIWIVAGSWILSAVGMVFVAYVVKTSGRDRPNDPEAVRRFIETAPNWRDDARFRQAFHQARGSVPQDVELGIDDDDHTSTRCP